MARFLALLGLGLVAACAQANPPTRPALSRVDDRADLLTPAAETRIAAELAELERRTTDQVQVITVPSLGGRTIEEVSLETARAESLGVRGRDNGVLLLVAPNERQIRIETGRGIAGVLTDGEAAGIIRNVLPDFRTGMMEHGIESAVNAIEKELSAEPKRPALLRKDEPWHA